MATNDDYRTASLTESSFTARSNTILVKEFQQIEKDGHELNTLNHRFATYLNKIIKLGEININLRRQIDDFYQNYRNSPEPIVRQLNSEFQNLISLQIRTQHADYDRKYYQNQLKSLSTSDQLRAIQQQLNTYLYELNLLKNQYENQVKDLQVIRE